MKLSELLTEEQLDELNRRDFLKQAGWAAMAAGLTAGALDQGSHKKPDQTVEVDDEDDDDDDDEIDV